MCMSIMPDHPGRRFDGCSFNRGLINIYIKKKACHDPEKDFYEFFLFILMDGSTSEKKTESVGRTRLFLLNLRQEIRVRDCTSQV